MAFINCWDSLCSHKLKENQQIQEAELISERHDSFNST